VFYILYAIYDKKRFLNFAKDANFKGKNVFITGGSSGIGKELSLRMNELGANVIISS